MKEDNTIKQIYKSGLFFMVFWNVLMVIIFAMVQQSFWHGLFTGTLNGGWSLFFINIDNYAQSGHTALFVNGDFIFLVTISIMNIIFASVIFNRLRSKSTGPTQNNAPALPDKSS
jgi:hypothetical protein